MGSGKTFIGLGFADKMKYKKKSVPFNDICKILDLFMIFLSTYIFQILTYERLNFRFGFRDKFQLINLCNRLNEIFSVIIKNNNFLIF